ncbi:hypothetical protein BABINDRAFT_163247, partial [Babjeviella inositovora NRRL Y-12698]
MPRSLTPYCPFFAMKLRITCIIVVRKYFRQVPFNCVRFPHPVYSYDTLKYLMEKDTERSYKPGECLESYEAKVLQIGKRRRGWPIGRNYTAQHGRENIPGRSLAQHVSLLLAPGI